MAHADSVPWGRIVIAGVAAYLFAVLLITGIVTVYAFVLAFEVRGTPDQARIQGLAESLGRYWGAAMVATGVLGGVWWVQRASRSHATIFGTFVGLVAGLVGAAFSEPEVSAAIELVLYTVTGGAAGLLLGRRKLRTRA
jgi:hypothetical protein